LFALTWPIFIEMMLYILMGNADTIMLSQYSDNAVAAVGVANQILSTAIIMFGFVASGTSVLVAQHLGARQEKQASEVSAVSLGVNLIFGMLISGILFFFAPQFMTWMKLPDELMGDALIYMRIT